MNRAARSIESKPYGTYFDYLYNNETALGELWDSFMFCNPTAEKSAVHAIVLRKIRDPKTPIRFVSSIINNSHQYNTPLAKSLWEYDLLLVDWDNVSSGKALDVCRRHQDKLSWSKVCQNPSLIDLVRENIDCEARINWSNMSCNYAAIDILAKNLGRVDAEKLSENYAAYKILENHAQQILSTNLNKDYIEITLSISSNKSFEFFSKKDNVLHFCQELERIDWGWLKARPLLTRKLFGTLTSPKAAETVSALKQLCECPDAVFVFEMFPQYIDWDSMAINPRAVHLLKPRRSTLDFKRLALNPRLLEIYDDVALPPAADPAIFVKNPSATSILFPLN
jgi:hypothetical protein